VNDQDFDYVRKLVRDRGALVLEPGKEYLVETRLEPLARAHRLGSVTELVARLRAQPFNGLHEQVVEAMVTTETSFFRDHHPFEALRTSVLPALVKLRGRERALTIWSAACSSGQEPYSIALLLRTQFPELAGWNVRLLASDLSGQVLARARQGCYNQIEMNRGLPASLLVRYFRQHGLEWQLDDSIRNTVEFHQINLAAAWPPLPRMDVLFLRNVLIYFDVETKKAILAKAARLLRPDGYLVLGGRKRPSTCMTRSSACRSTRRATTS
jgi:chemotaxis protein methyltransferase CheR